ncbi:hypothetical protein [Streptomyces sp. PU-14G]|uniref:hypothetical protein n=1 Tax=Streptomyces sp. PU-14G TaxID=2800808 RepID=UPI0034DF10DC
MSARAGADAEPDAHPPRWWRGKVRAALATVLLLLAATGLWRGGAFGDGGGREWESLCHGLPFPATETEKLLDGAELTPMTAEEKKDTYPDGDRRTCGVRHSEGSGRGSVVISLKPKRLPGGAPDNIPVPLGHGWNGNFTARPDHAGADDFDPSAHERRASAALVLDCGTKRPLALTASATLDTASFADPRKRTQLVAVATRMARTYHADTGCEGDLGRHVPDVGDSVATADFTPYADASGLCADLLSPAAARRLGVVTVVEPPAGRSPREQCVLGGLRGAPLYTLLAENWPRGGETPESPYTAHAARCTTTGQPARYALLPMETASHEPGPYAAHKALTALLTRFADRSAHRHGCGAVELREPDATSDAQARNEGATVRSFRGSAR